MGRLAALAGRNRVDLASFLGAGAYRHFSPPLVDQILLRGEWYTAYTPYQPEVSQGTLQSIYEYESLIAELTGLDVVSASHYDGAAATAEAALMTCRATGRDRVLVSRAVHPHYRAVLRTYFDGAGLDLEEIPLVADGPAAGTTDLAALERQLADADRPVGRRDPRPALVLRPARADGRGGAARARRGRAVRRRRRAGLARRPRAARRVRRGHRGGRGPAARHPAAVRRARTSGILACTDAARPPDPGPARRHDHGRRRPARVRDDAPGARAAHPAREGGQQHLHEPDAARARRERLAGGARAARPARRGGARRRERGRARGGARRRRRRRASTPAPTSTSSRSASRTRRPSTARCSPGACWRASCSPMPSRTTRPSPTRCSCARRKSPRPTRSRRSRAELADAVLGGPSRGWSA